MMELTVSPLLWILSENSNDCLQERMFPIRQTELIYQRKLPLFYQHNTSLLWSELFKYLQYTLGIQIPIFPALYWMDFPQMFGKFTWFDTLTHAYSHTRTQIIYDYISLFLLIHFLRLLSLCISFGYCYFSLRSL